MRFSYSSGSRPFSGYTIKRGIGVGGFGEVYFALNDAGKEVALKKIQKNLDVELRGVGYCLNLKHVNLISLWDIQSNQYGESWVVMEYVPGPSLRDVIEDTRTGMPTDAIKRWFTSIASGVAYLHEHGIVHRDLKPGNVFCDQDEQVIKIGDYGLSKFISCSQRSGQTEAVGTFHYMAPEIGKGEYGKEIDVYAMGIVLYEMLTGEVPFEGESTQEIIMKHLMMDPDLSNIPPEYHRVLSKSLRKDPQKRYHTIGDMVRELPWPEIADLGSQIVNQHSVGPIRFSIPPSANTKSTAGIAAKSSSPVSKPADKQVDDSSLPPAIASQSGVITGVINHSAAPTVTLGAESIGGDNEEPMALAVRSGLGDLNRWWNEANVSAPVRLALLVVGGIVVVQNSTWLLAAFVALATIYLLYYAARRYLLTPAQNSNEISKANTLDRQRIRKRLADRPAADQLTELTGSFLLGAIGEVVLSLFGLAIGLGGDDGLPGATFDDPAPLRGWAYWTWQTLICITAVWAVVGLTKTWTWEKSDFWLRLAMLSGVGACIGALTFFTATTFQIDLAQITAANFERTRTTGLALNGLAKLPALAIFFAALFVVNRMGRHTDPLRRTRLSVMNVIACLIVAAVGAHLLSLPLAFVCTFGVVVSIALQLASPWIHPDQRITVIGAQRG